MCRLCFLFGCVLDPPGFVLHYRVKGKVADAGFRYLYA